MNENKEICGRADYLKHFSISADRQKQSEILKYALEIRKFEIDLYWRRTGYFWGLIAATFAGYFALQKDNHSEPWLTFLITCIGFVLSLGWYLANRGSKYWQENWERHVDALENEIIGSLYKTTLAFKQKTIFRPFASYPFSVSKINQMISLYISLIWLGLACIAFQPFIPSLPFQLQTPHIIALVTLLCSIALVCCSQGSSQKKSTRKINFISVQVE